MISTLILISVLNLVSGDCLANQSEIYLDSITRFMSINDDDNSYNTMVKNGEKIIFTSENDSILGNHIIKTFGGKTYEIEILNLNQLKKYSLISNDDDIKITKLNPSLLLGDTFETSFSTIIITNTDDSKNWIESNDTLGINRYRLSSNCWTYLDK